MPPDCDLNLNLNLNLNNNILSVLNSERPSSHYANLPSAVSSVVSREPSTLFLGEVSVSVVSQVSSDIYIYTYIYIYI